MNKPKIEITIPTWPSDKGAARYGSEVFAPYGTCDSTRVSFRAQVGTDTWSTEEVRAYSDICLYIWFDNSQSISMDLRFSRTSGMTLQEAERRVKVLKSLTKKVEKAGVRLGDFYRNVSDVEIFNILCKVCHGMGIKRTIQYEASSSTPTYDPVSTALIAVMNDISARRLKL